MFTEPTPGPGSQVDSTTGKTSTTTDGLSASTGLARLRLSKQQPPRLENEVKPEETRTALLLNMLVDLLLVMAHFLLRDNCTRGWICMQQISLVPFLLWLNMYELVTWSLWVTGGRTYAHQKPTYNKVSAAHVPHLFAYVCASWQFDEPNNRVASKHLLYLVTAAVTPTLSQEWLTAAGWSRNILKIFLWYNTIKVSVLTGLPTVQGS